MPSPTPAWSSSRSILRPWAASRSPPRAAARPGVRRGRLPVVAPVDHVAVEQRRGVAQRRVEEQLEQVVGQVVVVRDVVACLLASVLRGGRGVRGTVTARSRCSGRGTRSCSSRGQHGQEAGEVVGLPGAGEVGLAEADQAVAAEPREELVRAVQHHRRTAAAVRRDAARAGRVLGGDLDGHRQPARRRRGTAGGRPRRTRGCAGRSGPGRVPASAQRLRGGLGTGGGEGHRFRHPPGGGWGRGRTGSRRAHSQRPWARMRSEPRSAAGAARRARRAPGRWRRPAARPGEGRAEGGAVVGVQGDGDVQPVAGDRHGEVVAAVGAVERRDVHRLLGPRAALLVGVDEVGVPVAVGVVHLDDRRRPAGRRRRSTRRR